MVQLPPSQYVFGIPTDWLRITIVALVVVIVPLMLVRLAPRMKPSHPESYSGPEAFARLAFIGVLASTGYASLEQLFGWHQPFRLVLLVPALAALAVSYVVITVVDWKERHRRG